MIQRQLDFGEKY